MPSRMIACSLALLAFAAATVAGIVVGNPAVTTVWRALLAMIGCYAIGSLLGTVAEWALSEHIEQYKRDHPLEPADTAPKDASETPAFRDQQDSPAGDDDSPRSGHTERKSEETSTDDAPSPAAATEQAAA